VLCANNNNLNVCEIIMSGRDAPAKFWVTSLGPGELLLAAAFSPILWIFLRELDVLRSTSSPASLTILLLLLLLVSTGSPPSRFVHAAKLASAVVISSPLLFLGLLFGASVMSLPLLVLLLLATFLASSHFPLFAAAGKGRLLRAQLFILGDIADGKASGNGTLVTAMAGVLDRVVVAVVATLVLGLGSLAFLYPKKETPPPSQWMDGWVSKTIMTLLSVLTCLAMAHCRNDLQLGARLAMDKLLALTTKIRNMSRVTKARPEAGMTNNVDCSYLWEL
jgi:hypothetical protein